MDAARHLELINGRRRGVGATLARAGLRLASWPYAVATRLRNLTYDRQWLQSHRAPVPVISVGNFTVGGTGKTPCVEYLARLLRSQDVRVAILSRGYGSDCGRNDEAMVLEENLSDVPQLQGVDRVELATTAVEELESEILLLDDGFQHRRLARDVDLVLVDVTNPWGYGALLPRGLLRESLRGLRRASAVILTRCEQATPQQVDAVERRIWRIAADVPVLHAEHRTVLSGTLEDSRAGLGGKRVAAFCGIGNPGAFRRTIEQLGMTISAWREYPDHHRYQRTDVEDLIDWAAAGEFDAVFTTQKDMVKLRLDRLSGRPLIALRVEFQITKGEETLHHLLTPYLPQ